MEPRRNLELKARDRDRTRSLIACASLGAEDHGILKQRDTYFNVATGRLKLREQDDAEAQLIAYERPNRKGERASTYRIVEVDNDGNLKGALAATLGIQVIVTKERRLWIWERTRIHLDRVVGLGNFIEFEAVAPPESDLAEERERVRLLRETFKIGEADLVAVSYCDLATATRAR